jgi:endoglucanase Acf2
VKAAAEAARHDRAWAADAQWGGLVRALIDDIACPRRNDPRWPFLRCFDPYAGHSWASGHARFADGNNQESSSEAMNAWAAILLWGQAAGDRPLRDLGIYLYTTEMRAVHEYWFDCLGRNRPKAYTPSKIAMVWGGKGVNETWFSKKPEVMHGINWLPIHGGSLYLGHYPDYVRRDYDALVAEKAGADWDEWADLVWMWRALADPQDALRQFDARADAFKPEGGNSRANTYHWIGNLAALGRVDASVTADYPLYAVFTGPRERTYVAYAMTGPPRTVTFSDGTTLPLTGPGFALKRRARTGNAAGKPAG